MVISKLIVCNLNSLLRKCSVHLCNQITFSLSVTFVTRCTAGIARSAVRSCVAVDGLLRGGQWGDGWPASFPSRIMGRTPYHPGSVQRTGLLHA